LKPFKNQHTVAIEHGSPASDGGRGLKLDGNQEWSATAADRPPVMAGAD